MIWSRIFKAHQRAAPPIAVDRDASGRFVSEHRQKVRAKCREICGAIHRDVPKELR
ncbi:hypothetical protein [Sphingopyxis sp. 113P3]|uniref:hypothetical protein n=1 Tax=Sphingopyxis sp. (strain 113P3) TaxID=292913 RepID=UPI0006BC3777|nr:hypothetical protein [Sphingopyxis sp. 113P3]ALC13818.1 cytochrome c oxidase subunit 2 [Sphingopyxis sp. 113P3]